MSQTGTVKRTFFARVRDRLFGRIEAIPGGNERNRAFWEHARAGERLRRCSREFVHNPG